MIPVYTLMVISIITLIIYGLVYSIEQAIEDHRMSQLMKRSREAIYREKRRDGR